jgi:hypothetical protein
MGLPVDYNRNRPIGETEKNIIGNIYSLTPRIPFDWTQLNNGGSGTGENSQHVFNARAASTTDGRVTFKAVDTFGDGWGIGASLSLFKDLNNAYKDDQGENVYVASHSWSRQDPYLGVATHHPVQMTGDQNVGHYQCDANYRSKLPDQSISAINTYKTHEECRDSCRSLGRDCTHYSWSIRMDHSGRGVRDPVDISAKAFEGIGPSTMSRNKENGICQIFSVRVAPLDIAREKVEHLFHGDGFDENDFIPEEGTWHDMAEKCAKVEGRLCRREEICPNGDGSSGDKTIPDGQPIGGSRRTHSYVPINGSKPGTDGEDWWLNLGSFDWNDATTDPTATPGKMSVNTCRDEKIKEEVATAAAFRVYRNELLCCFDTDKGDMMPDCPLHEFDNGLFTTAYNRIELGFNGKIGAIQRLKNFRNYQTPPTVTFKHNMNVKVVDRPIKGFGEDFDIELTIQKCPRGFYCPNVVPEPVTSQNINLKLSNYYDETKPKEGVMMIKCANFPYRKDSSASEADSWHLQSLHSTDFGSDYNYYCPGGTPYPIKVDGTKCAGNFTNNDPYMPSAEVECARAKFVDPTTGDENTEYDAGAVVKPGRAEFSVYVENNGEGNLQVQLSRFPKQAPQWLSVDGETSGLISNDDSSGLASKLELRFTINTGSIPAEENGQRVSDWIQLYWENGGRSGYLNYTVYVTPTVNENMLVFPFSITEQVESGEQKTVSLFVFNIGADYAWWPAVDNTTDNTTSRQTASLPAYVNLAGETDDLPCVEQDGQDLNDAMSCLVNKNQPPYMLGNKEFQRIDIILDGNRKAGAMPYTTEINIVGLKNDSNTAERIPDTATVPISMIITPGKADPTNTVLEYEVPSSSYYKNRLCYIDCAASGAIEGQPAYGRQWATQTWGSESMVLRNCFTRRVQEMSASSVDGATCGDCYTQTESQVCGKANELHKLETVRQSRIEAYIQVRDLFDVPAGLSPGSTIEVSLVDNAANKTQNTRAYTAAPSETGETGSFYVAVTPPARGNYTMTVMVVVPDSANPAQNLYYNISGSPFKVTARDPSCPPNSQAVATGSDCLCNPGYTRQKGETGTCSACPQGKAKAGAGNFECADCPDGKVAEAASAECTYCSEGKEPSLQTGSICEMCPVGKARAYNDQTTLVSQDAFCAKCPVGYVATSGGLFHCTLCDAGKADGSDGKSCDECVAGKSRRAQTWTEGTYDVVATPCSNCAPGQFSAASAAKNCTECEVGRFAGEEGGATVCGSCKGDPDTFYAPRGSAKCSGCVSPLVIASSSQASSINDCVCPEGTYLSSGTVSVSPVCSACPVGGYCPQGTTNVSKILAQVGYWRPDKETANFWQCPVSIVDQTLGEERWRNWATCYGGVDSTCSPVFSWREGSIWTKGSVGGTALTTVQNAMQQHSIPRTVARPDMFPNFMNSSSASGGTLTLSLAIASYMAAIHKDPNVADSGFTQYMKSVANGNVSAIFSGGESYESIESLAPFIDERLVVGYMSGPLCGICPPGTGRDGDFKSDSPCEPCPIDGSSNDWILVGFAALLLFVVLFFVYGQIKKGAHEVHLENEHIRESSKAPHTHDVETILPETGDNAQANVEEDELEKAYESGDSDSDIASDKSEEAEIGRGEDADEDEDGASENAGDKEEKDNIEVTAESDAEVGEEDGSDYDNTDAGTEAQDSSSEGKDAEVWKPAASSKHQRRRRRASGYVYSQEKTHFSKKDSELVKTIEQHREAQRAHGTLSGNLMSHKQILTGMSRIMMSYLQVVAVARSVPIKWPVEVIATLEVFAMVSAPSLSLVSVDCALSGDNAVELAKNSVPDGSSDMSAAFKPVYAKFILTMIIPILGVILPAIFWSLFYFFGKICLNSRRCRCCCDWADEMPSENQRNALKRYRNVQTIDDRNAADHYMRVKQRFKVTLMVVFFLFYPTIVKGVFSIFSCQPFGNTSYLVADMSVTCFDDEHNAFIIVASVFMVLYVFGIPFFGCYVLHKFLPGIHFDPTMPISKFNPSAGRKFERADRAELLAQKLEASAVYGFMWEGFQQKGIAPFWEWSVIMMRKVSIIFIIQILQNMKAEYQLTIALIIMFGFNLLHVKYHPYDLFYHDRLEMLSLVSSEMTLFGGLLITFLSGDKEHCESNCDELQDTSQSTASSIGVLIIFFNCVYLVYFGLGLLYHGYFVLVPPKLRCGKAEKAIADLHAKIPENVSRAVYPNHHHKLIEHHDLRDAEVMATKAQAQLDDNEAAIAKKLDSEKLAAKQKLEERKRKKAAKKAAKQGEMEAAVANVEGKNADQIMVEIEMPEREMSEHIAEGKSRKK